MNYHMADGSVCEHGIETRIYEGLHKYRERQYDVRATHVIVKPVVKHAIEGEVGRSCSMIWGLELLVSNEFDGEFMFAEKP